MQYLDDPSVTSGESDPKQEDEAAAHGARANGDEANKEDTGSDKQGEVGSSADDDVEAGSDSDDDIEAGLDADDDTETSSDADDGFDAGSDADDDVEADIQDQEDEADVRAAGTDGGADDDEAFDNDEEADADPAENRRANLAVAASLLLAVIVTVTAAIYAPPPPITPSSHRPGSMPITFPTSEVTFSTIHNIPRGGTGIANDNHQKWNGYHPSSSWTWPLGPGYDAGLQLSALIPRFVSVVFTSILHVLYFWHQLGGLDLVLLPLVWLLMGIIILYHG